MERNNMKKKLFSLLLTVILLTCSTGYGMKTYTQQENAAINAILDHPDFLKNLEEGKLSDNLLLLIQRATEKDRKQEIDALLKYLKTSPHFTRNARNFTSTLMFAIKMSNKPLIKAILFHPDFKEVHDFTPPPPFNRVWVIRRFNPNYQPPPTFKRVLNHAIAKKNKLVTKTILECLEHVFATPCIPNICYTILTYAKKTEHEWIIPLIPHKPHPDNFNKLLMRAILDKNNFIIKLIRNHPEFKPDFIIKEILQHLHDPQFKPTRAINILIYAIENQKESLIKIMLKYLEDHPTFQLNDFEKVIKTAIEHEKDCENDFIIETILRHHQDKNFHMNIRAMGEFGFMRGGASGLYLDSCSDILILGMQHKKEYIIKTMFKYLEEMQCSWKLKNFLINAIKDKNDLIVKTVLENPNFRLFDDCLYDILTCAIENHNDFAIKEILKHPKFAKKTLGSGYKTPLYQALRHKNIPAIKILLKHPKSEKVNSWNIEMFFILGMEYNETPIIEEMLKHPEFELSSGIVKKIFMPAIEQDNEFAITILLDILANPQYKIYININNLKKLLKHAAEHEQPRIIHAILDHKNFYINALKDMLIHAIKHNHELAITIMLKHLENELVKKDLSEECNVILSHAIKHNNTLVKKTLLSKPYAKNFNEMLLYAILRSPRDTSVIDALLQHSQYKPDFILEEILQHLEDPEFKPRDRKDILIYAIKNQKAPLIKIMLKYLEDHPTIYWSYGYIIRIAMEHNNDFVIKAMLKHLEKPEFQKDSTYILKNAIRYKKEFVIQAMLKYLEKIKNPDDLGSIFTCAIKYNHEFLINKILEHPTFKFLGFFKTTVQYAIEHNNDLLIKKVLEHPKLKPAHKAFNIILKHALEQNSNSLIEAIFKYLKQYFHNRDSYNSRSPLREILEKILLHAMKHQNESMIKAMLEQPFIKNSFLVCFFKHAIKHENEFVIQAVLEHSKFQPSLYNIKDNLMHAIEHKNESLILKIFKLPKLKFDEYRLKNILIHAIEQKYDPAIKIILEHKAPWVKKILLSQKTRNYEKFLLGFLAFIIKTVKSEDLEFKAKNNIVIQKFWTKNGNFLTKNVIEKKIRILTISSPTLKQHEIELTYYIEKDELFRITLSDTLVFKYPPKESYKDCKIFKKIEELIRTIITHPHFEITLHQEEIQAQKDLEERVEFMKNQVLEITPKEENKKIMLRGLGLGEFFGPKDITLLSPDAKRLQKIRKLQIQFLITKKLRFKKALQNIEKELSKKTDSLTKLKLLQKQLKQKNFFYRFIYQKDLDKNIKNLQKKIKFIKKQEQPYIKKELESTNQELKKLDF